MEVLRRTLNKAKKEMVGKVGRASKRARNPNVRPKTPWSYEVVRRVAIFAIDREINDAAAGQEFAVRQERLNRLPTRSTNGGAASAPGCHGTPTCSGTSLHTDGRMFWFRWKKLTGSYFVLISRSRR